jgi:DNA-binding CsgD family transcriptional regulator
MNIEDQLGVCLKTQEKKVVYQNESCLKTCGDMRGEICNKGCMESYAPVSGMSLMKNYCVANGAETDVVDAVVINHQDMLTTLLYHHNLSDKEDTHLREELLSFGLTKSELAIFSRVLKGAKNSEIIKEFFISKSTLKTHLNNIYKKLPENFQQFKKRR